MLPNAWDYASAAALAGLGFPAVGTTSLGVAAGAGKADGIGATRAETVDLARRLRGLPCLVSVDVEDGRPDGTFAPVDHQLSVIRVTTSRVPGMFVNAWTDTHRQRRPTTAALDDALRRVRGTRRPGPAGFSSRG